MYGKSASIGLPSQLLEMLCSATSPTTKSSGMICRNGIDVEIIHLIVWTKFFFEVDPVTDDITPSARAAIENFVVKVFCDIESGGIDRNRVIWFKNWKSLGPTGRRCYGKDCRCRCQ